MKRSSAPRSSRLRLTASGKPDKLGGPWEGAQVQAWQGQVDRHRQAEFRGEYGDGKFMLPFLGQRGAEPAEKRPTSGVGSQRRTALSRAIKLRSPYSSA